jgi:hypothetical protein
MYSIICSKNNSITPRSIKKHHRGRIANKSTIDDYIPHERCDSVEKHNFSIEISNSLG